MSNLLRRVWQEGTPLIDGNRGTFVWYGEEPPILRGDFNNWDAEAVPQWQQYRAEETADTSQVNMWCCELTFPEDAYIEYCFGLDGNRVRDPFNKRLIPNGWGELNHYFYMPKAGPTSLTRRRRRAPRGTVTRHQVPTERWAMGRRRKVYLYQPPVSEPVPLLIVYDGAKYFFHRVRLPVIVDNLIDQGRMRPVAMAMIANGGKKARFIEYACSESTLVFVHERVLPLARDQLNLLDISKQPGAYGVLGASLGGLMALFTGLRLPHIFGHVLSQSGAFHYDGHETVAVELVRHAEVRPLRIWMDVGRYEWLLDSNRKMHELLQSRGYDVSYHEFNAGHNWSAWRDNVWRGLEALFSVNEV